MYKKKNVTVMVMLTNLLPDPSHLPCPLSLIEVLLVVLQSLDWSLSEWESCYCDLGERLSAVSCQLSASLLGHKSSFPIPPETNPKIGEQLTKLQSTISRPVWI